MDCTFCKIAKGEFDSAKVHEDDKVLAFLDIQPVTQGHCLVIPKKHSENIHDIGQNYLEKIIVVAKNISQKMKDNLRADGIRLAQSNGAVAGQEVPHFHLHIIPRYKNDGVKMDLTGVSKPIKVEMDELKKIAEKIRA